MWLRSTTFILFAIAATTLALLHILALEFFLYWTYLWLDIPMHLLGGAVVSLGLLVCFPRVKLWLVLLFVLCVGCGWEVFEWVTGILYTETAPFADTALDLVMDLVGGAVGYGLAKQGRTLDE